PYPFKSVRPRVGRCTGLAFKDPVGTRPVGPKYPTGGTGPFVGLGIDPTDQGPGVLPLELTPTNQWASCPMLPGWHWNGQSGGSRTTVRDWHSGGRDVRRSGYGVFPYRSRKISFWQSLPKARKPPLPIAGKQSVSPHR